MRGSRRQRTALAVVGAVIALSSAFLVGRWTGDSPSETRLQALPGPDDLTGEDGDATSTTVEEPTTSSTEIPPETPVTPPPTAAPPPPTVAPVAPPPTTAGGAAATAAAKPTLDPGDPVCGPTNPGGPVRGDVVAVALADGIHELSLDGTRDVLIPGTAPPEGGAAWMQAAWSADGRRLAFIRPSATRQNRLRYPAQDLHVVDLERNCARVLTRSGIDSFRSPAWAPDGSRLSYIRELGDGGTSRENQMLETARDDGTDPVRLATGAMGGSWAPDGSGRLSFGQGGGLSVIDRSGKVTVVDNTTGGAEYESWSPDAQHLLYTVSVHQGVWVAAADGSKVRNLAPPSATGPTGIYWSRWSPDGKRIVFGWKDALWVVNADGSNPRAMVERTGSHNGGWWTPDGTALVHNGSGGVIVTPVDGGASRVLRSSGAVAAVFRRG